MNNHIQEADELEMSIVINYRHEKDWLPIMSYDMIQSGYPTPMSGLMIARPYGGVNEQGELLNGSGMWCKVSDVKKLLNKKNDFNYKVINSLLSIKRCQELIDISEAKGYEEADISYSSGSKMNKEYRNNERCLYTSEDLREELEVLLLNIVPPNITVNGKKCTFLKLSGRFRFYKYNPPQMFKKHRDANEPEDNGISIFTVLIYLNTAEEGGETRIFEPGRPEKILVEAVQGRTLIFNHNIAHTGEELKKGVKYVLRTDFIYKNDEESNPT